MNTACNHFRTASSYISKWIVAQPSVGEESITDWLLYTLSSNIASLKYKKFTKHQEARTTGADWEWWIVGENQSIRLRIQAKKLKANSDNYPSIAYSNAHGLQIDKLLSDASAINALPFYVFYSEPTSSNLLCGGNPSIRTENPAVLLTAAQTLDTQFVRPARKYVSADDVAGNSNPYECLVCCPLSIGTGNSSVQAIYEHIRYYYPGALDAEENSNIKSSNGLHEVLPKFVSTLLESGSEDTPEWWESEFSRQLPQVDSSVVWDLRENDL
jgi:hypothetical protein